MSESSQVAEKVRQFCEKFPEQRPISTGQAKLRPSEESGLSEQDRTKIQSLSDLAARIRQDITLIARSAKPMAIKDRVDYCRSALTDLGKQVAGLDEGRAGATKQRFAGQIEAMTKEVDQARAAGVQRAFQGVGQLGSAALKAVSEGQSLASGQDKNAAYKKIGTKLGELRREHTDWTAQVRDAGSWLGSDAKPLQVLLARVDEACAELDKLSAGCLPELTAKLPPTGSQGTKPPEGKPPKEIGKDEEEDTIRGLCKSSWVEAKQKFGAFPTQMKKLAAFRKREVDKWLVDTLTPWGLKKGPDTGWVSVGSDDPTSDYDISINKHGERQGSGGTEYYYDYKIVEDFNKHYRDTYGVESGSVFDTNLYAAAPASVPKLRENASEAETAALGEVQAANDVGALMKLRRYMAASDFEDYRSRTLAAASGDKAQLARLQAQFRMADANYMIALSATLEKMEKLLEGKEPEQLTEEQKHAKEIVDEWRAGAEKYSGLAMAEGEDAMERLARKLEHCKDANTAATNDLYTDAIKGVREQEAQVNGFNDRADGIREVIRSARPPSDPGAVPGFLSGLAKQLAEAGAGSAVTRPLTEAGDANAMERIAAALKGVDTQAAQMLSDLAQQKALAMFFANEAYQSGGPFQHVVWAGQAVETDLKTQWAIDRLGKDALDKLDADARDEAIKQEWEKRDETERKDAVAKLRAERRGALSKPQCLESFNEQLGDFLKDLAHYGGDDPGVAIIQSSKYLERLIDAVRLLDDNGMFAADEALRKDVLKQTAMQKRIADELIAARKGNLLLVPGDGQQPGTPVDQVEQRRAYACDFMKKLEITSVAGLGKRYSDLGIRINTVARRALATGG